MAASDNLHDVQFKFKKGNPRSPIGSESRHLVTAQKGEEEIGRLEWYSRGNRAISDVYVAEPHRRRGIATGMWNYAHEVAKETRGVQPPRHSADRTDAGDAWAKSVSKRIPQRLWHVPELGNRENRARVNWRITRVD